MQELSLMLMQSLQTANSLLEFNLLKKLTR